MYKTGAITFDFDKKSISQLDTPYRFTCTRLSQTYRVVNDKVLTLRLLVTGPERIMHIHLYTFGLHPLHRRCMGVAATYIFDVRASCKGVCASHCMGIGLSKGCGGMGCKAQSNEFNFFTAEDISFVFNKNVFQFHSMHIHPGHFVHL